MRIQQVCYCQPLQRQNKYYQSKQVNFGKKCLQRLKDLDALDELTANFLACDNLPKFKLTWDDALKMCRRHHHQVVTKQGSHAELRIAGGKGVVALVMPHEGENVMGVLDKKRIRAVLTGDYDTAFRLRR